MDAPPLTSPPATLPPSLSIGDVASSGLFTRLADIAGIAVDLRYASARNFVGADLYSPNDCAWLHRDAAQALAASVAWLATRHPGLRLLVLDALRPQHVQERLWARLEGTPLTQYLAHPTTGSIHSFGMAVDITLTGADGVELDLGTPFDDLTERSHPKYEARFLADGSLMPQQVERRQWLRDAMAAGGFAGISSEWWHFDCGDRRRVRERYRRVL